MSEDADRLEPTETPGSEPEAPGEPAPGFQLNVPMIDLELGGGIPIGVAPAPQLGEGGRALVIGPFLLRLFVPLSGEAARSVARDMSGGIEIASGLGGEQQRAAQAEGERARRLQGP